MNSDFKKRFAKGVGAKAFSQGIQIVIRFVEVPLFLYFWGAEFYGEWLILTALPVYLAISDFGFVDVTIRHMTMLVARRQRDEALKAFQASSVLVAIISGVIALIYFSIVWMLPISEIFHLERIGERELLLVAALLGLNVLVSMQARLLFGGLYSEGRYPLGFLLLSLIRISEFGAVAAVVILGGGPVAAASAMVLAQLIGALGMRFSVRRVAPWLQYGLRQFRWVTVRSLTKPAIAALAFPLGQALNYQGVRLVVGAVFGPSAVVVFMAHRQLARFVTLIQGLGVVFEAESTITYGAGELDRFRHLARRGAQVLIWGALITAVPLAIVGGSIFTIWTTGRLEYAQTLLGVLLLVSFAEVVWRSLLIPVIAANRHASVAAAYLVANILLIPAVYIGAIVGSILGVGLVLVLTELAIIFLMVHNSLDLTHDTLGKWLRFVIRPPFFLLREAKAAIGRRPSA